MGKIKKKLNNKYFLITGAAGLLGYQHAIALLQIDYNLILTDIELKKLNKYKKDFKKLFPKLKIIVSKMDVSRENSIKKLSLKLQRKKIELFGLLNNAAIDSKITKKNKMTNSGKLEKISLSEWNRHISVGLSGAMSCCKHFGPLIIKNKKGGVIINVASDLSVIAPNHSIYNKNVFKPVTYSVIKHGIIGLTKYISTYWSKHKIRCNAISPGPIFNNQSRSFIKKIKKQIPLNRMADKKEYRGAIQFLSSDASSYMTGHNLIIDGGRSVW